MRLLGAEPEPFTLPYRGKCPLCLTSNAMTICEDYIYSGQWCSCSNCGFHNDIVTLISKAYDISAEGAIRKLLLERIGQAHNDGYTISDIKVHLKRQELYNKHWAFFAKAQQRMLTDKSPVFQNILKKLRMNIGRNAEAWLSGPGRFMGSCHRHEGELAFSLEIKKYHGSGGTCTSRVFLGQRWTDVLCVPFYDVPGRIRGYAFYGRDCIISKGDLFYRFIPDRLQWHAPTLDAGLAFHGAASNISDETPAVLALVNGVLEAVQMHCWHASDYISTLPVVATWSTHVNATDARCWRTLSPAPEVVWGRECDKHWTLKHAKDANGRVATIPYPENGKGLKKTLPMEIYSEAVASAIPWYDALEHTLRLMTNPQGIALLQLMRMSPDEIRNFLAGCATDVKERYGRPEVRIAQIAAVAKIEERADGWYRTIGERLTNIVVHIHNAVHCKTHAGNLYYTGEFIYEGKTTPFWAISEHFEKNPTKYVREMLVKRNLPPPFISWKIRDHFSDIIHLFSDPIKSVNVDKLGWDREQQRIVTPNYIINSDGKVEDYSLQFFNKAFESVWQLPRPEGLLPGDIDVLGEKTAVNQLFWTCAAFCVSNILNNTVLSSASRGLMIVSESDASMIVAALAGCKPRNRTDITVNWPMVFKWESNQSNTTQRRYITELLTGGAADQVAICAPFWVAQSAAYYKGWDYVTYDDSREGLERLHDAGPKVLPNVLTDFISRHDEFGNMLNTVDALEAMAVWFDKLGGDITVILTALDHLSGGDRVNARIINTFLETVIRIHVEEDKYDLKLFNAKKNDDKYVAIPKKVVNAFLIERGGLTINTESLLAAAKAEKLQITYARRKGGCYWLVSENLWEARLHEYNKGQIDDPSVTYDDTPRLY